jgi:endonuclease III
MGSARTRPKFKKTGAIWGQPKRSRSHRVCSVCKVLLEEYGTPRFGNPFDPVSDLIYIILSNRTGATVAQRTYKALRIKFKSWDEILLKPISTLRKILRPAGLSAIKALQIRGALRKIQRDYGTCSLDALKSVTSTEAESYLLGLPGVSEKVAKCVMMYTLMLPVLPVDTHVHRIASRLGWTARRRSDQCHEELEALIPPRLRRIFHVVCIAHGRNICRPREPVCQNCKINGYCDFFKATQ